MLQLRAKFRWRPCGHNGMIWTLDSIQYKNNVPNSWGNDSDFWARQPRPEGFSYSFLINDSANPVCSIGETWNFSKRSDPRSSTGFLTSQCCKSFLEHLIEQGNTLISFCPNWSDFHGSTTDFFHQLSIQNTAFLHYSDSELGQLGFSKDPRFVASPYPSNA